ncbi:MAG: DUF503 domain-containing protein [Kurthia sp.]|uniref:Protein of uncharacterized function (DUF503) n=1 Tax=Kurthia zopfii TaxID=1650 RepID=A0A2U3ADY8_9BACL|nr:DUF503 domain-containing protein [Kurthia zopfii]PWI22772.1 DUF503 domain-containing protein [Kurthia zopfii]TDR41813.1 hypothetical protein DFR61_10552 [Kurthia zopfii]STX09124.1 Protein of uncharacterised function (DUF503) [Kurthia zopfii]VEI04661.1 Protein of uncharacterised function (DUF503) [Kurthia zopfii]GEK32011.1 hypothetical protein KZO01_23200 [Kurthia zopfii]
MIVYAECEFMIPTAHSLKEKRAVLERMKMRTKQRYNIALSEIDHQNVWQRTRLALVTVASNKVAADKEMDRAVEYLESNPDWQLLELHREYL